MEEVGKRSLSRNALLQKEVLERVKVVFDNGEFVFVKQMTGHERDNWEQTLVQEVKDAKGGITYERSLGDFRAKLAVATVCDEDGKATFLPEDYTLLSRNMSAKRLEKIVNVAQKLNAISEEDKEALVKNSVVGQADNSNSDSAEKSA